MSDSEVRSILKDARAGVLQRDIAIATGLHRWTVTRILKAAGFESFEGRMARRKAAEEIAPGDCEEGKFWERAKNDSERFVDLLRSGVK